MLRSVGSRRLGSWYPAASGFLDGPCPREPSPSRLAHPRLPLGSGRVRRACYAVGRLARRARAHPGCWRLGGVMSAARPRPRRLPGWAPGLPRPGGRRRDGILTCATMRRRGRSVQRHRPEPSHPQETSAPSRPRGLRSALARAPRAPSRRRRSRPPRRREHGGRDRRPQLGRCGPGPGRGLVHDRGPEGDRGHGAGDASAAEPRRARQGGPWERPWAEARQLRRPRPGGQHGDIPRSRFPRHGLPRGHRGPARPETVRSPPRGLRGQLALGRPRAARTGSTADGSATTPGALGGDPARERDRGAAMSTAPRKRRRRGGRGRGRKPAQTRGCGRRRRPRRRSPRTSEPAATRRSPAPPRPQAGDGRRRDLGR